MAENEKQVKTKGGKKLLWIGLGILGAGVLAFGGFSLFGLITLARDLLFTAVFADVALVGGTLAKAAVDSISDKIAARKQKQKENRRTRSTENKQSLNNENEEVVTMEAAPILTEVSGKTVTKIMEDGSDATDEELNAAEEERRVQASRK